MRTMVDPTLQRAEAVWAQAEWAKYGHRGDVVVADAVELHFTTSDLRSWAQLRLQHRITVHGQLDQPCPLCGDVAGAYVTHLLEECVVAKARCGRDPSEPTTEDDGWVTETQLMHPSGQDELGRGVSLSGRIGRAVGRAAIQARGAEGGAEEEQNSANP